MPRLRDRLGEEGRAYDTSGVAFESRPYDWFRRVIGFGAGDMVLRIGGPHPQIVELPNVVRVGKRLNVLEDRLRTKEVDSPLRRVVLARDQARGSQR